MHSARVIPVCSWHACRAYSPSGLSKPSLSLLRRLLLVADFDGLRLVVRVLLVGVVVVALGGAGAAAGGVTTGGAVIGAAAGGAGEGEVTGAGVCAEHADNETITRASPTTSGRWSNFMCVFPLFLRPLVTASAGLPSLTRISALQPLRSARATAEGALVRARLRARAVGREGADDGCSSSRVICTVGFGLVAELLTGLGFRRDSVGAELAVVAAGVLLSLAVLRRRAALAVGGSGVRDVAVGLHPLRCCGAWRGSRRGSGACAAGGAGGRGGRRGCGRGRWGRGLLGHTRRGRRRGSRSGRLVGRRAGRGCDAHPEDDSETEEDHDSHSCSIGVGHVPASLVHERAATRQFSSPDMHTGGRALDLRGIDGDKLRSHPRTRVVGG